MLRSSKLVLLYGETSIKLATFKHVSLNLNMISECYSCIAFGFTCIDFGTAKYQACFCIVADIFRKNQNKIVP